MRLILIPNGLRCVIENVECYVDDGGRIEIILEGGGMGVLFFLSLAIGIVCSCSTGRNACDFPLSQREADVFLYCVKGGVFFFVCVAVDKRSVSPKRGEVSLAHLCCPFFQVLGHKLLNSHLRRWFGFWRVHKTA